MPRSLRDVLRAGQVHGDSQRALPPAVASIGAIEHHNPVDDETATVIRSAAIGDVVDTERDGDCLFHCFYQSLRRSTWLEGYDMYAGVKDVYGMRAAIVRFMRQNPAYFEEAHQGTIRAKVAQHEERPIDSVTWEEALPLYCDIMARPTMWGGEPEMEAGAMLLGVIVHMFVVPQGGGSLRSARLNASFYPLTRMKESRAARKNATKFVFIHQNNHFLYVKPMMPMALRPAAPAPAPALAPAPQSAEERAMLLRNLRAKNQGNPPAIPTLKDLALEREERRKRQAGQTDGGSCSRIPATLTHKQREQVMDDAEYARWVHEMEEQSVKDAELAQSLAFLGYQDI